MQCDFENSEGSGKHVSLMSKLKISDLIKWSSSKFYII